MISNEQELRTTQERIERFQGWLAQLRRTARPEEFEAAASGYRLEVERMQAEALDYLLHPASVEREAPMALHDHKTT